MAAGKHTCRSAGIGLCAVVAVSLPICASAQVVTGLFGFGDSLTDTHNGFDLTPASSQPFVRSLYPGAPNYSNGTNYYNYLTALYGLRDSNATNYAIGGAESGSGNATYYLNHAFYGYTVEIQKFLASGVRISPTDLVTTTLGTNDSFLLPANPTRAEIAAQALSDANDLGAGTDAIYGRGARQFIFISGENNAVVPLVNLPASLLVLPPPAPVVTALLNDQYVDDERVLAPFAARGARVVLLDLSFLESRIAAAPGLFGFENATLGCSHVPACAAAPLAEQNNYFFWDIHPTEAGYNLIGRYVAAQFADQTTGSVPADVVLNIARDVTASILDRADSSPAGRDPGPQFFAEGLYAAGWSADRPGATGYGLGLGGAQLGVDDQIASDLLWGGAFAYSRGQASLTDNAGSLGVNSYTFAVYGRYEPSLFSLSGAASYTYANVDRFKLPGVVADLPVSASPDGYSINLTTHARYLVPLGAVSLGPSAGLVYGHGRLDGFTEQGDPLLTQSVAAQTTDVLTGQVGGETRAEIAPVTLRLNLAAAGDVLGTDRELDESLTSAPLVVNRIKVASEGRVYGVVAASAFAPITAPLSLYASVESTFAREYGDELLASIRVSFKF